MRHSKSLSSLATWSNKLRSSGSKGALDTATAAADERVYPTTANAYELLEDCGRGVSAVVYRARCVSTGEVVAVKALNLEMLTTPLEDIMHETHTMKAYKHESNLPLYCSFVTGEELWMVMPYMEGGSVAHIMRYKYPDGLSEAVIATIMKEVLRALVYMHSHGAIHRDVKAGNVLVDAEGRVKLGDFGVAATLEREGDWGGGSSRKRLTFVGTPCWMAPEVLEQSSGYGFAADIWSFGITLLEMAHGHAPFSKLPPMKVLLTTLQGPPPTLEASCGGRHFSRGMREVVARCLNKDPTKRPTAKELLEHRFFKQARDAEYLKKQLLAGLPPLPQRCHEIRAGKAATAATANDRAAMASHISYMTDVAQWDFNCCKSLTGPGNQAGSSSSLKGPDSQAGSIPDSQAGSQAGGIAHDQQQQQQREQSSAASDEAAAVAHAHTQQQQQQGPDLRATPAPPAATSSSSSSLGHHHTSPFTKGADQPAFPAADVQTTAAAAAAAGAENLAVCYSGGQQVAAFAVSGPSTPERSPRDSRPNTPGPGTAAAAAAESAFRPGTAGSAAKRHGRFTIREGSEPYQGPENNEYSEKPPLHSSSVCIGALAKQRSISSPEIATLAALRAGQGAAAAAAAGVGSGVAGPASHHHQQQQPEHHHGLICKLSHLLERQHSPGGHHPSKQQQQQQQSPQRYHRSTFPGAGVTATRDPHHTSTAATSAAASSPAAAAALPPLGRAAASLADIYPSHRTSHPGGGSVGTSLSEVHGAPARTSSPTGVKSGGKSEHHTAAQVWGQVKEACAEAVAHVAHTLHAHHGSSSRSSSPQRHKSPEPYQQQQQQRVQQHVQEGTEGAPAVAAAAVSPVVASNAGTAVSPAGPANTGVTTRQGAAANGAIAAAAAGGCSKPPKYQPAAAKQQQQQQVVVLKPPGSPTESTPSAAAAAAAAAATPRGAAGGKHELDVLPAAAAPTAPVTPAAVSSSTNGLPAQQQQQQQEEPESKQETLIEPVATADASLTAAAAAAAVAAAGPAAAASNLGHSDDVTIVRDQPIKSSTDTLAQSDVPAAVMSELHEQEHAADAAAADALVFATHTTAERHRHGRVFNKHEQHEGPDLPAAAAAVAVAASAAVAAVLPAAEAVAAGKSLEAAAAELHPGHDALEAALAAEQQAADDTRRLAAAAVAAAATSAVRGSPVKPAAAATADVCPLIDQHHHQQQQQQQLSGVVQIKQPGMTHFVSPAKQHQQHPGSVSASDVQGTGSCKQRGRFKITQT